jgi:hypothetical protein
MSQHTSPSVETRVSQHDLTPNHTNAIIDLSGDTDFLKDDMVIEWLFVEWQKQIQRATNTR